MSFGFFVSQFMIWAHFHQQYNQTYASVRFGAEKSKRQ